MSDAPLNEAERQQAFERDKVCYEQNFEQFRAMNQIMWQVPLLAMTITGGLWYAALTVPEAQEMRRPLMLLSAVFDFALVAVLWRVRYVMGQYLKALKAFNPPAYVEAPGGGIFDRPHTVIWAFTIALILAGVGSAVGFFNLPLLRFEWC